jgi:dihydroorotase
MLLMLQYVKEGRISIEKVVEKMAHAPAVCFQIAERGYIREGYHADLVLVNLNMPYTVTKQNILYKCGWSPFDGHSFPATIHSTYVNGEKVYELGNIYDHAMGARLKFDR